MALSRSDSQITIIPLYRIPLREFSSFLAGAHRAPIYYVPGVRFAFLSLAVQHPTTDRALKIVYVNSTCTAIILLSFQLEYH